MGAIAAVAAKIVVLTLVAIYGDGHLDSLSFVAPTGVTIEQCQTAAQGTAEAWHEQDPDILAIKSYCDEKDDPRPALEDFLKDHPVPEEAPKAPPHIPGDHEA